LTPTGHVALPSAQASKGQGVPVATGDWPMYGHDVSRTNFNPDEHTINAGNAGQLVQRWQALIGSNGTGPFSAPSVANGRVYVGSSVPTGNDFFAFDAVTGTPAWSANVNYVDSGCFNVGIGSTAAVSGNIVATGGGDSAYYGLNASTGAQVWRNPMNVGDSGFPWASPLIASGRAYVGMASRCDNPSVRGELRALDLNTGAQVATAYFVPAGQAGAGIWQSPALSPDGTTLVVTTGEDYNGYDGPYNRAIVSLDPTTLAIRQADKEGQSGQDEDFGTTPIIFHDSQGRTLTGANHKNGIFYAYVLNNINAGPIWQKNWGTSVGFMPAYDPTSGSGGTLFIGGGGGPTIGAVDPATGADRWAAGSVVTGGGGNMAIANGLIYTNDGGNGVKILDETNSNIIQTLVPPHAGDSNSGVAVSNGFIYWISGSYINAWSLPGTPPPSPTPRCSGQRFADVCPGDYFYQAVTYLTNHNVISGYPDGTFRPYNNATRGQTSKIVVLAENWAINTAGGPHFSDVPSSNPFYTFIETAYHHNVISGYPDGTFHPGYNVTRGQLCKIIVLARAWAINLTGGPHFSDVPTGNTFYMYIETAYNHAIISGYPDGTFRPGNNATRGQISKIVYNAITQP
jgi:outer membrane protein assembly factor BamB